MPYNGCVYETFGVSKRFPIKLQLFLIRAETLVKPLTAKCFIHVVVHWCSVFLSFLSFNLLLRFCLPCVGFGGSFVIFGFSVGLCELQMCHQMRGHYLTINGLNESINSSIFVSLSNLARINLLSIVLKHLPFTNLKFFSTKSSIFSC